MKKILFAALFVAVATWGSQAQDQSEFKKETIEFIELTGAGAAFENAIDQLGAAVPADKKGDYIAEAQGTLDGLYSKLAELYMVEFTRDEIKELVNFYKSDLGKKLAGKQLTLMEKGMSLGQNWGMELYAIAQKYN